MASVAGILPTNHRQAKAASWMPVVRVLQHKDFCELAHYYSTLTSPARGQNVTEYQAQLEQSDTLAEQGDLSSQIPVCNGDHRTKDVPATPLLNKSGWPPST
jgi:hypothetical protein